MAGSRKGEKRGAAGRAIRNNPGDFKKGNPGGPGRPKGSRKFRVDLSPQVGEKARGGPHKATLEREREIHRIITGHAEVLPRDAMMQVMRHFLGQAKAYQDLLAANLSIEPKTPQQKAAIDSILGECEIKIERYLLLGADVAYKLAPYIHPRLSAIAVAPQNEKSTDLLGLLLDELDGVGRQREFTMIEHDSEC